MSDDTNRQQWADRYYDKPDRLDPAAETETIATRCGATCASCVVLYGKYHGAVWDESTRSVTHDLLRIAQEEGATIPHAGVEYIPEPSGFCTWRRSDVEPGERRAWFEFQLD